MNFVFVSGRPGLDFLGTRKWRAGPAPEEQLAAASDLAEWAVVSGVVTDRPTVSARQHARAVELREALFRVVTDRMAVRRPDQADLRTVNEAARGRPVRLEAAEGGAVRRTGTADQLLATLASDVLDLLGSDRVALIRGCANPDCTRLFVDESRGRSRRWCGMAECGNRAKVQAFRSRQGEHQAGRRTAVRSSST